MVLVFVKVMRGDSWCKRMEFISFIEDAYIEYVCTFWFRKYCERDTSQSPMTDHHSPFQVGHILKTNQKIIDKINKFALRMHGL